MKITKLATLTTLAVVLTLAVAGCKKKPVRTTPLPGQAVTQIGDADAAKPMGLNEGLATTPVTQPNADTTGMGSKLGQGDVVPLSQGDISGRPQDRETFKSDTVYFDFDRSTIKPSEAPKIDAVAEQFKNMPAANDLLIEGNCDERGTEEYNRALGERRALAVREYLIRAGVNPEKIHTISFGEDKPVALGHDDAAWALNRRADFVVVLPR